LAGLAIRGREIVVYLTCERDEQESLLVELGPHRMGKCCLYMKRLGDIDSSVLEKLVLNSIADVKPCHEQHNTD
jgi:hypothetical protein